MGEMNQMMIEECIYYAFFEAVHCTMYFKQHIYEHILDNRRVRIDETIIYERSGAIMACQPPENV